MLAGIGKLGAMVFFTAVMGGCFSYDLQTLGSIDSSKKTVTVPAGGSGLTGDIKEMLREEGWELRVDRGPDVTEGTLGEETRLEAHESYRTRYRLHVSYRRSIDWSFRFQDIYRYDISLVDNETGGEVITLSGKGENKVIVERLREAIESAGNESSSETTGASATTPERTRRHLVSDCYVHTPLCPG